MGVVTTGIPNSPAPAKVNVTNQKNALSVFPILNQPFYLGDGLKGRGTGQTKSVYIPDSATSLYFGFVDGSGFQGAAGAYGDNVGTLSVTYSITISPIVSLKNPNDGTTIPGSANLSLTASASDQDGLISKVEFFQGSTKLGEARMAPYTSEWINVAPGSYTLKAVATGNDGLMGT